MQWDKRSVGLNLSYHPSVTRPGLFYLIYARVFCFTEPDYELLCSGALCRTRLFAADNLLPAD